MFCELPKFNLTELYRKMDELGVYDAIQKVTWHLMDIKITLFQ